MEEQSISKAHAVFGVVSKSVAGVVFLSFVVGLAFTHGWYSGFGLLAETNQAQDFLSYIGFYAIFLLVPHIAQVIFETMLNWYVVAGGLAGAAILGFLKWYSSEKSEKDYSPTINKAGWIFYTALICAMVPLEATKLGTKKAHEKIDDLLHNGCMPNKQKWNNCHEIVVDDKLYKRGYLVVRSDKTLTLFDIKKQQLDTFDLPANAVIRRSYASSND